MSEVSEEWLEPGSNDEVVSRVVDRQLSEGGYARVPVAVALDRRVKGVALKVYVVLASALRYTGTVSIGMRLISEKTGIKIQHVQRAIKQLEAAGHVKIIPKDRGMRGTYILTANIFHEKQGKVNLRASSSEGRPIQVSVDSRNPHGYPYYADEREFE